LQEKKISEYNFPFAEKCSDFALFVVFAAGKPYISTAMRRKQSTIPLTARKNAQYYILLQKFLNLLILFMRQRGGFLSIFPR